MNAGHGSGVAGVLSSNFSLRATDVPAANGSSHADLDCSMTYVSVPWQSIVRDMLDFGLAERPLYDGPAASTQPVVRHGPLEG